MKKTMSTPVTGPERRSFGQKNYAAKAIMESDNEIEHSYWVKAKASSGRKPNTDLLPMAAFNKARKSFSIPQ